MDSKDSKQTLILINAALISYTESILVVLRHKKLTRYALIYRAGSVFCV
jgi:hypothetical protein